MCSALVVDDPTVGDVVGAYLQRAGFEVHRAADGAAALALAATTAPDVVVLDLMLPGIGGLEVCPRVRHDHPRIPVVMLTALGEEEDRILARGRRRRLRRGTQLVPAKRPLTAMRTHAGMA